MQRLNYNNMNMSRKYVLKPITRERNEQVPRPHNNKKSTRIIFKESPCKTCTGFLGDGNEESKIKENAGVKALKGLLGRVKNYSMGVKESAWKEQGFDDVEEMIQGMEENAQDFGGDQIQQVILICDMIVNKLYKLEQYKTMNLITRLKKLGEPVDQAMNELEECCSLNLNPKNISLYLTILDKFIKALINKNKCQEKPKEPGIHISGSINSYLKSQIGCIITQEFTNYLQLTFDSHSTEIQTLKSNSSSQFTSLQSEISSLQSQLTSLQVQLSTAKSQLTSFSSESSSLQNSLSSKETEITSLQSQIASLQSKISTLTNNLSLKDQSISKLTQIHTEVLGLKENSERECLQLQKENDDLRQELDSITQNFKICSEGQLEEIQSKVQEKERIAEDWKNKFESLKQFFELQKQEVNSLKNNCEKFKELIEKSQNALLNNPSQAKELEDKIQECLKLKIEIQNQRDEKQNLYVKLTLLNQEVTDLKQVIKDFTKYNSNIDETYESVLKAEFERMKAAFEQRISELQEDLKQQRRDFQNEICDKTKTIRYLSENVEQLTRRLSKQRGKVI